ncbi:DUF502 domain-containing protein [Chitinilyticum piscinae]|uniref:DUF502 domain-containing protein n=1 Tax=Chitinilyticum piscinae TaxID=2866724 RepID=UPI001D16BDED|nr:DUF502 domain-containing protein [Chitinilyticum piscinae]
MISLRRYVIAGLLIWVPLAITIWVLNLIISTMDQLGALLPSFLRPDFWLLQGMGPNVPFLGGRDHIPGFGVILTVLVVLLTGVLATNLLGRRLLRYWDELLKRIPIVNSIYSSVKQVSDTLFSDSGNAFREAVLVQFPHQGAWTVAFLTGVPGGEVARQLGEVLDGELVSVYVPTTPNPTSGYFVMVRRADIKPLAMSVDQALKYVISMGVVMPEAPAASPQLHSSAALLHGQSAAQPGEQ